MLVTEYFKVNKILDLTCVCGCFVRFGFQIITRDAKNLRVLELGNCKWLNSGLLDPVLQLNKHLCHIDISYCASVSNSSLPILAANAPSLKILNLSNCHWTSAAAIVSISLNCPNLESLDVTSCEGITDEAICSVAENCPSAVNHNCQYIKRINSDVMKRYPASDVSSSEESD